MPPRTYYFDAKGQANPFGRTNRKWNDCTARRAYTQEFDERYRRIAEEINALKED